MEEWFIRINRIAATHRDQYFDNAPDQSNYSAWSYLHAGSCPLDV